MGKRITFLRDIHWKTNHLLLGNSNDGAFFAHAKSIFPSPEQTPLFSHSLNNVKL